MTFDFKERYILIKNKQAFFLTGSFLVILVLTIFYCGPAYALDAKALFEIGAGDKKSPAASGFDLPPSFCAYEKYRAAAVLDARQNRVCVYSFDGALRSEIKLPFKTKAIDMAYFPSAGKLFLVFQKSPAIGVIDVDLFADKPRAVSSEIMDISEAAGSNTAMLQKIWPCGSADSNECSFVVNAASGKNRNLSFRYAGKKLVSGPKIDPAITFAAASQGAPLALGIDNSTGEAVLLTHDIAADKVHKYILLEEFVPKSIGYGCRGCNVTGGDAGKNIYVEAFYSASDENIKKAFVYRFSGSGRFSGRTEIFASPEMFTNRYIFIDDAGNIFYMKNDPKKAVIGFYRFRISELN